MGHPIPETALPLWIDLEIHKAALLLSCVFHRMATHTTSFLCLSTRLPNKPFLSVGAIGAVTNTHVADDVVLLLSDDRRSRREEALLQPEGMSNQIRV